MDINFFYKLGCLISDTLCCHLDEKYLFLLIATKLQDCCDRYAVKEHAKDCWDVLCEDESVTCANEPWVFFEQFAKEGCDQHAKTSSHVANCNPDESNQSN